MPTVTGVPSLAHRAPLRLTAGDMMRAADRERCSGCGHSVTRSARVTFTATSGRLVTVSTRHLLCLRRFGYQWLDQHVPVPLTPPAPGRSAAALLPAADRPYVRVSATGASANSRVGG